MGYVTVIIATPQLLVGIRLPLGDGVVFFEARMNSSHLPWGSRVFFTHLPFTTKCQHVLLNRPHCSVRISSTTADTLHSVRRSMADPSVFFWTAFYMFSNIKSWQLHLILFMKMLSHVFLLKVFISRKLLCSVVDLITLMQCIIFAHLFTTTQYSPLFCHTNHSVCLKPVATRQTISSHSLTVLALSTTQQKPVD